MSRDKIYLAGKPALFFVFLAVFFSPGLNAQKKEKLNLEGELEIKFSVEKLRNPNGYIRAFLYNRKNGFPTKPKKANNKINIRISISYISNN